MAAEDADLKHTPLYDLHVAQGARMVPFAGYLMPVQYARGILAEHRHTRELAGLFDVSHMGQLRIPGEGAAAALERLVTGDIRGLAPGQMRYTLLTNDQGGILDDLMVTRREDDLLLVVNAARKAFDVAHLRAGLEGFDVELLDDRALLALQGPAAAAVMARLAPAAAELTFLGAAAVEVAGIPCWVSRSGYTGEDGFEISVADAHAVELAERLLAEDEVAPIGLGARDSLRLEAGLCLYGHDIDETTTPVEAALVWAISKPRRACGDFPGAAVILEQLERGAPRRRVGIRPEGRAPVREGAEIVDDAGAVIGRITSGGFGPSVGGPVAMGYVATRYAKPGERVGVSLRGRTVAAEVAKLPFVPHRYVRAPSPPKTAKGGGS